jgi:hypothetical protein
LCYTLSVVTLRSIPAVLSCPVINAINNIHQTTSHIAISYTNHTRLHSLYSTTCVSVQTNKQTNKNFWTSSSDLASLPHFMYSRVTSLLTTSLHHFLPCCLCGAIIYVMRVSVVHDCESHPQFTTDTSVRSFYCAAITYFSQ